MVLGLDAQIFEDGVGPEAFHVVLLLSVHDSNSMFSIIPSSQFVHGE